MKAALTDGKGKVWIEEIPRPVPGDYECLCKTMACATCTGTDTKHIHDKLPWAQAYPGLLGHESVGVVIEVGKKVRNFKEGDVVLRPAVAFPGTQFAGYTSMWGGFAEYGLVGDAAAMRADDPAAKPNNYTRFQQVIPADAGISFVEATMLITLKECASYVASSGVRFRSRVLVLGAGSVGICMIRFAKIYGAHPVIAVARRDEQLAYAKDVIGADEVINVSQQDLLKTVAELTDGQGVDRIIDTTGSADFLASALPALAEGGKVGAYATYTRGKARAEIVAPELEAGGATGEDIAHQYLLDAVKLGLVKLSDYLQPCDASCRPPEGIRDGRQQGGLQGRCHHGGSVMKTTAVVFPEANRFELRELTLREPGPADIVVRTLLSAISPGTERWCLRGLHLGSTFPCVPGYHRIGLVEAKGKDVTAFEVGDVVYGTGNAWEEKVTSMWGAHVGRSVSPAGGYKLVAKTMPDQAELEGISFAILAGVSNRGVNAVNVQGRADHA